MVVYIDSNFKCHIENDGTMTAIETPFFDGKCDTYIEGYRFVPHGASWVRSDGVVFTGQMIAPWQDYSELDEVQRAYEARQLAEYENLINELYEQVVT